MIKVDIVNEVNNREFGARFESKTLADDWIEKCSAKQSWGLNERSMPKADVPEELEDRIIDEYVQERLGTGEEGLEVIELIEFATIKADYVVTVKNLNLSKTFRNQKKIESRKSEYPTMEEVLHIILDKGLDSIEMLALQADRDAIKAKYPLE